jgi:hypothetical protein
VTIERLKDAIKVTARCIVYHDSRRSPGRLAVPSIYVVCIVAIWFGLETHGVPLEEQLEGVMNERIAVEGPFGGKGVEGTGVGPDPRKLGPHVGFPVQ